MAENIIFINDFPVKLIPLGECACGCGRKTRTAKKTDYSRHRFVGQPYKFILGHTQKGKMGAFAPNWKGGTKNYSGYPAIYDPDHPRANAEGYVLEHIVKAAKALGKPLPPNAEIHHVNGTRNSGQLVICQDKVYHHLLHRRMRALKACGHANWRKCRHCKQWDNPINLHIHVYNGCERTYHRECYNKYQRMLYAKRHGL